MIGLRRYIPVALHLHSQMFVVRPIEESFSSTEKDHYHTFMSNALSF